MALVKKKPVRRGAKAERRQASKKDRVRGGGRTPALKGVRQNEKGNSLGVGNRDAGGGDRKPEGCPTTSRLLSRLKKQRSKGGAPIVHRYGCLEWWILPDGRIYFKPIRKVDELELDRKRIAREIDQARRDAATAAAARSVTEHQVGRMLDAMATDMERLDRATLKDFLFGMCEGITLNPETLTAGIHYKIPLVRRDRLASPRAADPIPLGKAVSYVKIRRAA